jgi:hypothetical protein
MSESATVTGFRPRRSSASVQGWIRQVIRIGVQAVRRVGYLRASYPRPLGTRPPIDLAVCAIFQDEAPYLAEWIRFHQLQGVQRFWLYNNRSTDDWRSALAPYVDAGMATVTPWPDRPGQFSAYSDCLKRHRDDARWIAFIDIDEFLFSPTGAPLPAVLRRFNHVPAVAANWRVYGASGHATRPSGLVTANYTWRARDEHPANQHVKSIVYPRKVSLWVQNPHNFRTYGPTVGEDGVPFQSSFRSSATADLLRINHYCLKSTADVARRLARDDVGYGRPRRRDELLIPPDDVQDDILMRFVPSLRVPDAQPR